MADAQRWGKLENYHADWRERARIAAAYLDGCQSVVDFGAGKQDLRRYIAGHYLAVDFVELMPGTIIADFDQDWSAELVAHCDGVAVLGLLEHIKDPAAFLQKISGIGKVWAVSYMDSRKHAHPLMPLADLERCFTAAGMRIQRAVTWRHQRVYRLVRC